MQLSTVSLSNSKMNNKYMGKKTYTQRYLKHNLHITPKKKNVGDLFYSVSNV